jgi:hypothetical protein
MPGRPRCPGTPPTTTRPGIRRRRREASKSREAGLAHWRSSRNRTTGDSGDPIEEKKRRSPSCRRSLARTPPSGELLAAAAAAAVVFVVVVREPPFSVACSCSGRVSLPAAAPSKSSSVCRAGTSSATIWTVSLCGASALRTLRSWEGDACLDEMSAYSVSAWTIA